MALEDDQGMCTSKSPSATLWKKAKALKLQTLQRSRQQKKLLWLKEVNMRIHRYYRSPKNKIIYMKRRASLEAGTSAGNTTSNGVERRIKVLQRLLPSDDQSCSNGLELDGLFELAADYILFLEMQVKVMQFMVKVLSDTN